jgi:transcriptional regulator with XRE-family HTH domain
MHYLDELREKRKRAGLKQHELGAAVGVEKAHISRIETGTRKASAGLIVRLAMLFGDDPIAALKQANVLEARRRGHTAKRHLSADTMTHEGAPDCDIVRRRREESKSG